MANPLDELLHHKHGASRELLAALRPEDLDRARDAAMERANPNRIKAIGLLVSARAPGTDALLVTILRNREESSVVRAAAAGQLGRLGTDTQPEKMFLGLHWLRFIRAAPRARVVPRSPVRTGPDAGGAQSGGSP
jgi:hypothetical protein